MKTHAQDQAGCHHYRQAHHLPKYQNKEEIPPSLENAILSFFIGSAVRKIRGQSDQHNSMMIHVTRFKDVQEKVKLQVENFVEKIKSAEFGNETHEILKRLKLIWESDFIHTINNELNPYKKEIPFNDILKNIFSEKGVIRQLEYVRLRGGVEDTLEYDNFKKVGKTVIVIGGQKLSRGLTLEGLSVSYFLRTAQLLLADTMTQMGRFFGYRKGYLDLCRLYITQPLNDVFHEFANSLTHLDSQFIEAAIGELTPKEYMYIVRESSQFRITSKSKSRDTVLQKLQFSGSLSQSIHLWQNEDNIVHNKKAVEKLLLSLGKNYTHGFEFEDEDKNSIVPNQRRILWKNIDSKNIIEFFKDYKTTPYARHNNSHCIREYIQLCNSEKGELMNWSVQLASGPRM